jgi:hypothetical protein
VDVTTTVALVLGTLLIIVGIAYLLAPTHLLQATGAATLAGGLGGVLSMALCTALYPAASAYCAVAGAVSSAITSVLTFSLTVPHGGHGFVVTFG